MTRADIDIIRALAEQAATIADLPVQEEKRALWRALNAKRPVRPMVMIDQVCWNEMNVDDELTLRCADEECRMYEERLRRTLYQWRHFPCDMVVEPYMRVRKALSGWHYGVSAREETMAGDPTNDVVSHHYINQFETDADLDKITMPTIAHDAAETRRRLDVAHTLFDGILEVEPYGVDPQVCFWDPISTWMGVEGALWALADRPEYMHEMLRRMKASYLAGLDYIEEHGLLCHHQTLIHCTGAYTDELPAQGFDAAKPRTRDIWVMGLAQMFSTVSPVMFEEFEVEYIRDICARYGLVYYGCCDPLDNKMDQVRGIPNVRKVSVSTWANQTRAAERMGGDYVFSRKPNPAFLAGVAFSAEQVYEDLRNTVDICARGGCPLEIILKDISTVLRDPRRLWEWEKIAMKAAGAL